MVKLRWLQPIRLPIASWPLPESPRARPAPFPPSPAAGSTFAAAREVVSWSAWRSERRQSDDGERSLLVCGARHLDSQFTQLLGLNHIGRAGHEVGRFLR